MSNKGSTEKPLLQESKKEHVSGVRPLGEDGSPKEGPWLGGIRLAESITVGRPIGEVYGYGGDFTNLPLFCKYLKDVKFLDETRSRGPVEGRGGNPLPGEATVIEDRHNELISWRSFEDSDFT